jgi:5-formyltetrahydrofolate cyclo-ligase
MKRSSSINRNKSSLRQWYKTERDQITTACRSHAAFSAAQLFTASNFFKKNNLFACYSPCKSEFDTSEIVNAILQANKQCYLPVVQGETLLFRQYEKGMTLVANAFGILEPPSSASLISPEALDVVIVPLLAFDEQRNRLGTGGGYYDKTFQFKTAHPTARPLLVGLGYDVQKADHLPADSWDIKLDAVVTEKQVFLFKCS